jgi:hypothetical protein
MMTSKNLIFGTVFGLIFIFGGTFVFFENDKQVQNNSEYNSQTNNTGTNTLPVTRSGTQVPELSQSEDSLSETKNTLSQSGFVFHTPNTEWKARTITLSDGQVVTYRFGEGNPEEVMPKIEDLQGWKLNSYMDSVMVRPKTERILLEFLSNPTLATVINKCASFIQPRNNISTGLELSLPDVLFTTDFSMEGMITVNPNTGQKELNINKFNLFGIIFEQIGMPISEAVESPWKIQLPCLDKNEIEAYKKLIYQLGAINLSWMNNSTENQEEIQKFLQ